MLYTQYQSTSITSTEDPMATEERHDKADHEKIVRLKVDGASTAVNTLRDQQTALGISLICPFPALEVDIPVRFGQGRKTDMNAGTIHRISVEDDVETGLPRLRLSIRATEARDTVVASAPQSPLGDPLNEDPKPEVSDLGIIELTNIKETPDSEEIDNHYPDSNCNGQDTSKSTPVADEDILQSCSDSSFDPPWADCGSVPFPEELFSHRPRGRATRIAAKTAAWVSVFALVFAGGFVMERVGFLDMSKLRSYVSGFSMGSSFAEKQHSAEPSLEQEDPLDLLQRHPEEARKEPMGDALQAASDSPPPSQVEPTKRTLASGVSVDENEKISDENPRPETIKKEHPNTEDLETNAPLASKENETPSAEEGDILLSEVTVVLPTKWPVEYASAYRIRNPNGVVVDVPGGLVRKEGWLESGINHPMIRSIKAIQRETGARYVVYVHGVLPRFMTSPKTGGIALRLYHNKGEATSTEQVAMAN